MQKTAPLQLAGLGPSVVVPLLPDQMLAWQPSQGTQALRAQEQLSYSRQNEQEADREGLKPYLIREWKPDPCLTCSKECCKTTDTQPTNSLSTFPLTHSPPPGSLTPKQG